ncbi:hypothetical protein OROHE_018684 [Orobanche hederae]
MAGGEDWDHEKMLVGFVCARLFVEEAADIFMKEANVPRTPVASKQVRFQPQTGKLLATATGNSINFIDTQIQSGVLFNLEGHTNEVLCICSDKKFGFILNRHKEVAIIIILIRRRV